MTSTPSIACSRLLTRRQRVGWVGAGVATPARPVHPVPGFDGGPDRRVEASTSATFSAMGHFALGEPTARRNRGRTVEDKPERTEESQTRVRLEGHRRIGGSSGAAPRRHASHVSRVAHPAARAVALSCGTMSERQDRPGSG